MVKKKRKVVKRKPKPAAASKPADQAAALRKFLYPHASD
jgi:hypothetical protein